MNRQDMAQSDYFRNSVAGSMASSNPWNTPSYIYGSPPVRSPTAAMASVSRVWNRTSDDTSNAPFHDSQAGVFPRLTSVTPAASGFSLSSVNHNSGLTPPGRPESAYSAAPSYTTCPTPALFHSNLPTPFGSHKNSSSTAWDFQDGFSPSDSVDDIITSPNLSDYSLENGIGGAPIKSKQATKPRVQRRPSNRDEFDGPHQFLTRPSSEYIVGQERELPRLPTNLLIQEQDTILTKVNDRLSQCAFDFIAKYQFPIPLTPELRPVDSPQDREWTEWVYLLKRLATKRRIPARVLYNGQIKQFVTVLENSLEMRHASKHQSRPLKDDRNILQLISAGIQVAKILKDAAAMEVLDKLYVSTEKLIRDRAAGSYR